MRYISLHTKFSVTAAFLASAASLSTPNAFGQDDLPPLPPNVNNLLPAPSPRAWFPTEGIAPSPRTVIQVDSAEYAGDQVIVKFKEGVSEGLIQNTLKAYGLEQKSHIRNTGVRLLTFPGPLDARYFVPLLQKLPIVENATMNALGHLNGSPQVPQVPQDELYPAQWNLRQIDIDRVWSFTWGGNFRIAILDTGIKTDHPDLTDKLVRDINNNVIGFSVVPNETFYDVHGHGTFVSSIAAAKTVFSNGYAGSGIAGVDPNGQIIPVKVLNSSFQNGYYSGNQITYYNVSSG